MIRLWERFADWILWLGLVLVSLIVLLTINQPMVRGLRARALELSSTVENQLAAAGRYMGALRENERLREENIRLSSDLALSREATLENERLRALLALPDSVFGPRVPARVVSKDVTRQRNTLTIAAGMRDGVREGMAVIDTRGIVGVVDLVSGGHAKVKSYLNPGFVTPVKIHPNLSDGLLARHPTNPHRLEVRHVPRTDPVTTGQVVVTSGYSGIFRPGLSVGVIDSVYTVEGELSWRIRVQPASPLSDLHHVFVLLDLPNPDRIAIEQPDS